MVWNGRGERLARFPSRAPFRGSLAADKLLGVFDQGLGIRSGKGYRQRLLLRGAPALATLRRTFLSAEGNVGAALHRAEGLAGPADAVSFWRTRNGRKIGLTRVRSQRRLLDVALTRDGRLAVVCGDRGRQEAFCRLLRLGKGVAQVAGWRSKAHRTIYSVAVDPAGKRLALALTGEIVVLSLPRLKVLARRKVSAMASLFPPRLRRYLDPFPSAHVLRFSAGGDELFTFHGTRVVGVGRWRLSGLVPRGWLPRPRTLKGAIKQISSGPKGELWLLAGAGGLAVERYVGRGRRFERTLRFVPGASTR